MYFYGRINGRKEMYFMSIRRIRIRLLWSGKHPPGSPFYRETAARMEFSSQYNLKWMKIVRFVASVGKWLQDGKYVGNGLITFHRPLIMTKANIWCRLIIVLSNEITNSLCFNCPLSKLTRNLQVVSQLR